MNHTPLTTFRFSYLFLISSVCLYLHSLLPIGRLTRGISCINNVLYSVNNWVRTAGWRTCRGEMSLRQLTLLIIAMRWLAKETESTYLEEENESWLIKSSSLTLFYFLSLFFPLFTLFCYHAHIPMFQETYLLSPWLAKVTRRPQPSESDSPADPLHMESFLSRHWRSQRAAAELAMWEIIFTFIICKCSIMLCCAALFIIGQCDPIIPHWAVPAGCRWTHQAGRESKD